MLSNYTIKQALPRLIIAAIAINVSYWVCGLFIDISNLLGQSLMRLLVSVHHETIDSTSFEAIMTAVLTGTNVATGGLFLTTALGYLAILAGMGPTILIGLALMMVSAFLGIVAAIFIALLILAARQALIFILVVISPIAFALYILPGTKPLFDRWRKIFTTMLVLFPLFALMWGGAQLAGGILLAASGQTGIDASLGSTLLIMALIAQFAPLFFTPWLLKNSSGILGKIGDRLQQRSKALTSMPGNKGRDIFKKGAVGTGKFAKAGFQRFAMRRGDRRGGKALRALAFAGVAREAAERQYEEELKENVAQHSLNDSRLLERHAATMRAKKSTDSLEDEADTHALLNNEGVRTAVTAKESSSITKSLAKGELEDAAKADHLGNEDMRALYLRKEVSSAQLTRQKAEHDQLTEELKSEAGRRRRGYVSGGENEGLADLAQDLGTASAATHISGQAKTNATRILTGEHANEIMTNATQAELAGGIDEQFGAQRAVAQAESIIEQQVQEGVKVEETTLGSTSEEDLLHRVTTGKAVVENPDGTTSEVDLSTEAQMAAASVISKRGYAGNHIAMMRNLNARMRKIAEDKGYITAAETQARGAISRSDFDPGKKGDRAYEQAVAANAKERVKTMLINDTDESTKAIRFMQKQAINTLGNNTPFGVGDQMRGDWGRGVGYDDYDKEWAERLTVKGKLNTPAIQTIKSEDMGWIRENLQPGGYLNDPSKGVSLDDTKKALQASLDSHLKSPDAVARTKPEIKAFFNELREKGIIDTSFDNYEGGGIEASTSASPKPARTGTRAGTPVPDSAAGNFTRGYSQDDIERMDEAGISSFISTAGGVQNLSDDDVDKLFTGVDIRKGKNRTISKTLYDEYTRRGF